MILHYKAEKNSKARTHRNSSSSWDWGVWHRPLVQVVTWWGWYDCWSLDWGSWRASGLTTGLAGLDLRSCEHSGEVSSVGLVCQHWNPISRQPKTLWWSVICLLWLEGQRESLLCSVSVCLVWCYKPTMMCKQKRFNLKSLQNLASDFSVLFAVSQAHEVIAEYELHSWLYLFMKTEQAWGIGGDHITSVFFW